MYEHKRRTLKRGEGLWFYLLLSLLLYGAAALPGAVLAASSGTGATPEAALQMLKEGNARFVAGQPKHPHQDAARRAETVSGGQKPFVTIVGCSDSRHSLEILFDQGIGDIFVVRVAGNIAGTSELGSVEYGAGHLHTPLLVVLGHSHCGAVTAAAQNAKTHGSIPAILNQIKPAVAKVKAKNPGIEGDDLVNKAIKANVLLTMETIFRKSPEVRELVRDGHLQVVGAISDLRTGQVEWLGQLPNQCVLLYADEAAAAKPKTSEHAPVAKAKSADHAPAAAKAEPKHEPEPTTTRVRHF